MNFQLDLHYQRETPFIHVNEGQNGNYCNLHSLSEVQFYGGLRTRINFSSSVRGELERPEINRHVGHWNRKYTDNSGSLSHLIFDKEAKNIYARKKIISLSTGVGLSACQKMKLDPISLCTKIKFKKSKT